MAGGSMATRIPQTASLLPSFLLHHSPCHLPGSSSVLSAHSMKSSTLVSISLTQISIITRNIALWCRRDMQVPCKGKIRVNHKETTGIETAPWPHWTSCIHPPNKQLFVVHTHSKHLARGRWCCNINTRIENSSVRYHFFILQKGGFFWGSPLSDSGEHTTIKAESWWCFSRLANTKESRKEIWAQIEQQKGLAQAFQHTREPHHYQPVWGVSLLGEVFHQTISDQPSCYLPPKSLTKPITPA